MTPLTDCGEHEVPVGPDFLPRLWMGSKEQGNGFQEPRRLVAMHLGFGELPRAETSDLTRAPLQLQHRGNKKSAFGSEALRPSSLLWNIRQCHCVVTSDGGAWLQPSQGPLRHGGVCCSGHGRHSCKFAEDQAQCLEDKLSFLAHELARIPQSSAILFGITVHGRLESFIKELK